jgi:integrase
MSLSAGWLLLGAHGGVVAAQTAASKALPVVYVLSTGGTIAGRGSSATDLTNYRSGTILGEELVDAVPQIREVANVKVEQVVNVNSTEITLDNWLTLMRRINVIFASDSAVAGVVVTHGTNTLEETAYFLNLTVKDPRPVVVVGAMRPATAISADGPLNLLNAVRVTTTKGNRIRYVQLTNRLKKALQQHRHLRSRRVLCEADGKPLTANALTYLVERSTRAAGLASGRKPKGAGPHVLRHTFCSHLAMRGAPARAIQELAGHRDLMTTQHYMHLSPAARESAIRLLDTPVRGGNGETGETDSANSNG